MDIKSLVIGKMDWRECCNEHRVKEAKPDSNKIRGLLKIADRKIEGMNQLSDEHYYAKITLLYDALRSYLEVIALKKGYKIYNHECYTPFLKEIMSDSDTGDKFDKLRSIRNGINYYGRELNLVEGKEAIARLKEVIQILKLKYLN